MQCYNCKKEIDDKKPHWVYLIDKSKVFACSDGCYMYSRLVLEHTKKEDFIKELKKYHNRWIKEMTPFLSKEELAPLEEKSELPKKNKKWYEFWKK